MANKTTIKEILIKFMEWQMETKPLIANFTHNTVANHFLNKYPELDDISEDCPKGYIKNDNGKLMFDITTLIDD